MKARWGWLILLSLLFLVIGWLYNAFWNRPPEAKVISVGHVCQRVLIDGESKSTVKRRWGKALMTHTQNLEKFTRGFHRLSLSRAHDIDLPAYDEVWEYENRSGMMQRFVLFNKGYVAYCWEKWSDF